MNQTDLKHKLSAPFDFNEWKNILAQMFPKIDYLAKETSVDNNLVKNGGQIGVIHLNDGRSLGLFRLLTIYIFLVTEKAYEKLRLNMLTKIL